MQWPCLETKQGHFRFPTNRISPKTGLHAPPNKILVGAMRGRAGPCAMRKRGPWPGATGLGSGPRSELALLSVGVIAAVGYDDVVGKVDAHHVAGLLYALRQAVVVAAWARVLAGVVVGQGEDGGVVEQCLAHDDAHVNSRFADAAVRDALPLYELEVLVHEQYPRLLGVEVLHERVQVVVYGCGRAEVGALLGLFELPPLAKLAGGEDGDGLGRAHAFVAGEVGHGALAERVKVVVAVAEHSLHEAHCALVG